MSEINIVCEQTIFFTSEKNRPSNQKAETMIFTCEKNRLNSLAFSRACKQHGDVKSGAVKELLEASIIRFRKQVRTTFKLKIILFFNKLLL